jgi:hypothetical protein
MNTRTLSPSSLATISQYLHFQAGSAVCSVPYFNNKTRGSRGALRTHIGKGSPQDIAEETETLLKLKHISPETLSDEALKKLLTDSAIGIDCSGFVYHVLNAESLEQKKGGLEKHLSFVQCPGVLGKIRGHMRPAENSGVVTFAHDENSKVVSVNEVQPGDMITMLPGTTVEAPFDHIKVVASTGAERDHILVVHQVEYSDAVPTKIHYSQAVAYPEDGVYGTGIKQGTIEITDPSQPLLSQRWIENGFEGTSNRIFVRAQKSTTQLRRLNWL